jgi:Family of unknown function (DUF6152)
MRHPVLTWSVASVLAVQVFSVEAHHAVTTHYDPSKKIELRGVVVDIKLRSPHSSFVVDGVAVIDGVVQSTASERWEVESHSVPGMRNLGIDKDTFRPGEAITILGLPNRK